MRFMVIVYPGGKAAREYEKTGIMPSDDVMLEMGKFNEALIEAGIMEAAEGLRPSAQGTRLDFKGGKPSVTQGPFNADDRLVGGFWIWNVKSEAEALDWAKRAPMEVGDTLEVRRIAEAEDFSDEVQKKESELVEKMQKQKRG